MGFFMSAAGVASCECATGPGVGPKRFHANQAAAATSAITRNFRIGASAFIMHQPAANRPIVLRRGECQASAVLRRLSPALALAALAACAEPPAAATPPDPAPPGVTFT